MKPTSGGGIRCDARCPALALGALAAALLAPGARAQVIFADTFDTEPSALWSNFRGQWFAANGEYNASQPTNSPCTATLLPFVLTDCEIEMDIRAVSDGGVWISSSEDTSNAVLLVTGGNTHTGTGFYWHTVRNGGFSGGLAGSGSLFSQGDDIHIRVTARYGDAVTWFSVYLNGDPQPASTLTIPADFFPTPGGLVGLYDFTTPGQRFDNVTVRAGVGCPADFNGDGFLDFFDADAFVGCFEGDGCPPGASADFNGDGFVDFFDFNAFVDSFEAGC